MSADNWIDLAAAPALVVLVVLIAACTYRVVRGPTPADRLQGMDAMTTLLISTIVVLVVVQRDERLIDVAIGLAAFSFIGTIAISRYLSEGRMF